MSTLRTFKESSSLNEVSETSGEPLTATNVALGDGFEASLVLTIPAESLSGFHRTRHSS